MIKSPGQLLPQAAAEFGDKVALVTATRTMSFADLDRASDRIAAALAAQGVEPGRTVSLYSQNRWEWLVSYHGVLKAGAVVNPINVMLTPGEVEYVLRDCEAAMVFVGDDQAPDVVNVTKRLDQPCLVVSFGSAVEGALTFDDLLAADGPVPDHGLTPAGPCTIGYTSGTTGHPKGAVQSHRAVAANIGLTATMHGRSSQDIMVTALPAAHVYGNVAINSTWLVGGTVVLMERFRPTEALRLIAEHRATMFEGVPAMYSTMMAEPVIEDTDLSSLRQCTVGGQTIPVSTIERWERYSGCPLLELWGMTEVAGLGTTHPVHVPGPKGSIGVPLPGIEVKIADLTDPTRDAPRGEAGELLIRGSIVMLGYYRNPAATEEVLEESGWLHTGDLARRDEDGYVFVVDRLKDMIITGGYNVYPAEIERALSSHPEISLVAVGSVPDPHKGELACAYVIRSQGSALTEEEVLAYAAQQLAAYKRPRLVKFVDDVPKTSSGKIMRRKLGTVVAEATP